MELRALDHPLVSHKVTLLRSVETGSPVFRQLVEELVTLLAYEATRDVRVDDCEVTTPITVTKGKKLSQPRPLVVPILRDADQMSIADIEKAIVDYAVKAKDGKIALEELTGGTFSITNGGTFGSMMSTPIINPPQSAILGMHATKERAMVENGQVVVLPMMYLALSYDHRIIDGREAVLTLVAIKDALEDPARLLLDL